MVAFMKIRDPAQREAIISAVAEFSRREMGGEVTLAKQF